MDYFFIVSTPAPYNEPQTARLTFSDISSILSIVISVGGIFVVYLALKSKSEAQELDNNTIKHTAAQMETLEVRIEKMVDKVVDKISTSMDRLDKLTLDLSIRLAIIENEQKSLSNNQRQIETMRAKQEDIDHRLTLIEQQIKTKS
jgi:hypothetical protein